MTYNPNGASSTGGGSSCDAAFQASGTADTTVGFALGGCEAALLTASGMARELP